MVTSGNRLSPEPMATRFFVTIWPLQWRHNDHDSVSNHQPHDCFLNRLFRRRSKRTSKLHVTGFCVGNSPVTGEFPAQKASNAENVFIWWRHHDVSREQCVNASSSSMQSIIGTDVITHLQQSVARWRNIYGFTKLGNIDSGCDLLPDNNKLFITCTIVDIPDRADFRFAPSQWETVLLCNDVSHWLGANLEPAMLSSMGFGTILIEDNHWKIASYGFVTRIIIFLKAEYRTFEITGISPRGQWINGVPRPQGGRLERV